MNKYKIGIWGQFGDGLNMIADGQAVRTTIITNELKTWYGAENILIVNSNNWRKHPLIFLKNTISLLKKCEKVIIFPADNGFKTIVPIYDCLNKIYKKEMYDVVIGGYLPGILSNQPKYLSMLTKYNALFVQTPNLKKDLENLGLSNIHILSNLKRLNTRMVTDIFTNNEKFIRVCTMSRVTESKGIDDAVAAVKMANEYLGEICITLDIYGIVAPDYQEHFNNLVSDNCSFVKYCGVIKYDQTVETLKSYFAMLFPTFYYGEGFPGNVIDAYNSGLPLIATDWRYNKDVITNGINGVLVQPHDPIAIRDALLTLYNNREMAKTISINNLNSAEQYTPEKVLQEFFSILDK